MSGLISGILPSQHSRVHIPGPIEIFQALRNKRAHYQGIQDGIGDESEILEKHLPVLEYMIDSLFGKRDLRLLRLPFTDRAQSEFIPDILHDASVEVIPTIPLQGVHSDLQIEVARQLPCSNPGLKRWRQ